MKRKIKVMVFTLLLVLFSLLVIVPTSVDAGMYPGYMTIGKHGDTCACPQLWFWNCTCHIVE